jgi:hypothetical protein
MTNNLPSLDDKHDFLANMDSYRLENSGSRNFGIFKYKNQIIKIAKKEKSLKQETARELREVVQNLGLKDRVIIAKDIIDVDYNGIPSCLIVMPIAFGIQADKLPKGYIENIPMHHFEQFENDVRSLSEVGVAIDLTKRSNFFYSATKGFVFIDIDVYTAKPTNKFIEKDGKQFYYEFERFPYFPKEYTNSRDLFLNISN